MVLDRTKYQWHFDVDWESKGRFGQDQMSANWSMSNKQIRWDRKYNRDYHRLEEERNGELLLNGYRVCVYVMKILGNRL